MSAFVVITLVGSIGPANAYLDPATGSMILQAILGGIAGLAVIGRVYWYKIKSFFVPPNESTDDRADSPPEDN